MRGVPSPDLLAKSKQLIYFRFAFVAAAFCFVVLAARFAHADIDPVTILGPCLFVLFFNLCGLLFIAKNPGAKMSAVNGLNAVLLCADIVALTLTVHLTHGIESDLFFLYLLPTLLASNVFGRVGIFLTAILTSSAYLAVLMAENWSFLPYLYAVTGPEGLTAAYAQRLFTQIASRSGILFVLSVIWAIFCSRMSVIAQENMTRLAEQLEANTAKNLELRQMQSQLIHQEKMASLGRIVAGIAHELNNPINFVHGNLPYLREYFDDLKQLVLCLEELPEASRQRIQEMKKKINYDFLITDLDNIIADLTDGSERVWHIVRNLRSFSRLDEAELKEASIQEGLESTLKMLSQYYGQDKIAVETKFTPLPVVLCYPGKLNQVWMNLLANAAHAVSGRMEAKVTISTTLADGYVTVAIQDNGTGIKDGDRSKIFEPFFTTKPVGQGTGLGLSICHSIIERHGGSIWFESVDGKGTTFFVKIPLKAAVDQAEEQRKEQVLAVDDPSWHAEQGP